MYKVGDVIKSAVPDSSYGSDDKLKEIARKLKNADLAKKVINDILDSFRKDGIPTK